MKCKRCGEEHSVLFAGHCDNCLNEGARGLQKFFLSLAGIRDPNPPPVSGIIDQRVPLAEEMNLS